MPHAILTWYEAICLAYLGKAHILEEYEETVSSPSVTMYIPAVMQLKNAIAMTKKSVKFSRMNVFSRDGFRCQYCDHRRTARELNYDHVVPRRQGGRTTWDNIVSCCYDCNTKKGGRTPEQASMKLLRKPARPHALPLHAVYLDGDAIPDAWQPYLDLSKVQPSGRGYYLVHHADHVATLSREGNCVA